MKRFLLNAALFLAGLLAVTAGVDRQVGRYIRHHDGRLGDRTVVGPDVYQALSAAREPGPGVRVIYLGDSVARQLFPAGDRAPGVRSLCCNQAVSMAGQYDLLCRALRQCPGVREVDLIYHPGSWANDLPRELSHDYFCGYFHEPGEIVETFRVTHDFDLLAAHVGRWLAPNLLAANGASRPFAPLAGPLAPPKPPANREMAGPAPAGSDPEPLLSALTRACRGPRPPGPAGASGVSLAFLSRLRALCGERGIRLRVLCSPCSDASRQEDAAGLYDAPILYLGRDWYLPDGVHFRRSKVAEARRRTVRAYCLDEPGSQVGDRP